MMMLLSWLDLVEASLGVHCALSGEDKAVQFFNRCIKSNKLEIYLYIEGKLFTYGKKTCSSNRYWGCFSSGNSAEESWKAVLEGKSGIGLLTRLDSDNFL